jgi:TonB family protein
VLLAAIVSLGVSLWVSPVLAQTTAPARAENKAENKADNKADAESAAAMERARRIADNPMRLILEASRRGARGVVVTPVADAADGSSLRRTAAGGEAPAAVVPAVAPPPAATAPSPPLQQLRSELAAAPSGAAPEPTAAQIVPASLPAAATAPVLSALPSLPAAQRLESAAPQLLRMVDPEIPERVVDQAGGRRDVVVEFTIRPDGTTADISLLPPSPRQFQRFVVDAVTQWRYAPLSEARRMRVQIVFNNS